MILAPLTASGLLTSFLMGLPVSLHFEPSSSSSAHFRQPPGKIAESGESIEFTESLELALQNAAVSKKPVVLIFGAIWCASCKAFRADTLPAAAVLERADQFEWVFVNIDREQFLAREYGVKSTPQIFTLHYSGRRLQQAIGNLRPREFRAFLDTSLELAEKRAQPGADQPALGSVLAEDHTELTWSPEGYRANSICYSHVGYGPFDIPSQSPNALFRLSPRPHTPSTLTAGQTQVRWNENLTNFWAFKQGEYRLDYGALTSSLGVSYGLTDTVQVDFEFIDFRRFDSVLDGVTNTFHDIVGLDDSDRDLVPRGENVVQFGTVDSRDESVYSDDFAVSLQHNVTCGTEAAPAFSYALTARTNVGSNVERASGTNLSLGLSTAASRRLSDESYIYGGLSYVWNGGNEPIDLALEETQLSALLAGEWRYAARSSWILQYLWTEAVSDGTAPFDKATHEFNIGWKGEFEGNYVFEISLIENAIVVDNSPDFGFHLGLSKRY